MSIPFTQYLRPNGETRDMTIQMADDVEEKAKVVLSRGCWFDIEELSTGIISMTCDCNYDNETINLAIELSENGEAVIDAVAVLVNRAFNICRDEVKFMSYKEEMMYGDG